MKSSKNLASIFKGKFYFLIFLSKLNKVQLKNKKEAKRGRGASMRGFKKSVTKSIGMISKLQTPLSKIRK